MPQRLSAPFPPLFNVTDAHSHVSSQEFDEDRDEMLMRSAQSGVVRIVDIDYQEDAASKKQMARLNGIDLICGAGIHPHDASSYREDKNQLLAALDSKQYSMVGEIGLDFYRNLSPHDEQISAFIDQLDLAVEYRLPVAIHSRQADQKTFEILEHWCKRTTGYLGPEREPGMIHCFSGNSELAGRYIDLGFQISISGIATFKNEINAPEVIISSPISSILAETDAPYLTPEPHRGKRNEPIYVLDTIRFIGKLKGMPAQTVADTTSANLIRLLGMDE
jgi:TatD DNase family protein